MLFKKLKIKILIIKLYSWIMKCHLLMEPNLLKLLGNMKYNKNFSIDENKGYAVK